MLWHAKPKVKLALLVNGLYLLTFFTPSPSPPNARQHLFAHTRRQPSAREAPAGLPAHVPLPPPSGPSRVAAYESGGMLHVSLSNDLTLVKRPGRTLVLSPSFSAPTLPAEEPEFVRLNFILYSDKGTCPGNCPLLIKADGETLWPENASDDSRLNTYSWRRGNVPHTSTTSEDGLVIETMAAESFETLMPYDAFMRMISAGHVTIRLGPDWVELTANQIETLRDMYRRLPQLPPPDDSHSY
jgi:hypothetical protein